MATKASFLIFLNLVLCIKLFAANYYISNSGMDTNSGSLEKPWNTLFYATQQLSAGDTLFVLPGLYNEYCTIDQSGTIESPIVITTRKEERNQALIDGSGLSIQLYGDFPNSKNSKVLAA